MSTEERLVQLERSFVTVTDLLRGQSERMDTHGSWINELGRAQAETERKIAALVDAQINTEDKLVRLESAVERLAEKVDLLVDSQAQTDARLAALVNTVERYVSGGRSRESG